MFKFSRLHLFFLRVRIWRTTGRGRWWGWSRWWRRWPWPNSRPAWASSWKSILKHTCLKMGSFSLYTRQLVIYFASVQWSHNTICGCWNKDGGWMQIWVNKSCLKPALEMTATGSIQSFSQQTMSLQCMLGEAWFHIERNGGLHFRHTSINLSNSSTLKMKIRIFE